MSYPNINRKCSVCQCCGICDYEHEIEIGKVSGDYQPMKANFMNKDKERKVK